MGEMHKYYYAIFLSLVLVIACHGRQIKQSNQHSLPWLNTIIAPLKVKTNLQVKLLAPIDVDSSAGANYANAFRPTTPGNSPGVGHRKFGGENKVMMLVQSPDVKVAAAEAEGIFKNGFRPTNPGHSPGIGH
ncbi:hypothetical protein SESBI_15387 [Sesbania bispinosa]|nr:hypothetical protein SESBI_15387 [Sesbania bispinosa]